MSAKGVRKTNKCKACNQAVKGHLGPYGLGKCTVGQEDKNENLEEKIEEEVEKHRVNGEAKLSQQEDVGAITTETKENKSDDKSYVEPSLFLGDSSGGLKKEDDRKRLMSFSDCDIDIRKLLMGRSFELCRCDNTDCDCDGKVEFPEDSLEGEVTELYFGHYLDTDIDFKPTLKLEKKGWNKAEPNIVRLKMGGITAPGVIASNGELVLTASRVVEMVKGRRELSTDLRGSLSLQLKVSSSYTKRGVRSPIRYKDIECFLYMLDKLMDEVEDSPRISAESEDEIERAEGYGTVSNTK